MPRSLGGRAGHRPRPDDAALIWGERHVTDRRSSFVESSVPSVSSAASVSSASAEPEGEVKARTGGAALVECLSAHDVPLWTCVPGESFLPVLDALWEAGVGVINTRHEAAAANMAEAAGKLTGRAAVCLVTRGPGASHASIALHTAFQDGTPLVLVVGQVDRELLGRDAFQEMDYQRVFGSSAKAVLTIDDADRLHPRAGRAGDAGRAQRTPGTGGAGGAGGRSV